MRVVAGRRIVKRRDVGVVRTHVRCFLERSRAIRVLVDATYSKVHQRPLKMGFVFHGPDYRGPPVDRIFDMGRTTVNITGDAACAVVVSAAQRKKQNKAKA